MSGGYILPQEEGEHQVVIFTFIGPVTPEQATQWNKRVLELKNMFVNKKVRSYLAGVTVKGESDTETEEMLRQEKEKEEMTASKTKQSPSRRAAKAKQISRPI